MNKLFIEAEGGNAEAQAKAAELCFVTGDHNGAWKLANLSAAQGNPLGLYALGMCHINGYNTAKDVEKARQLFQESANRGCARALTGLAAVYAEDGRPFCREAVELIRKAAEANDAKGLYMLSLLHKEGIRAVRSLHKYHSLLTQAAEQDYIPAVYHLGELYLAEDTPWHDNKKGVEFIGKAADAGFAEAQAHIAWLTLEGELLPKDEAKAFRMFNEAAEKGCAKAMRSLGFCYLNGQGVSPDNDMAGEWFLRAASLGLSDCDELARIAAGGMDNLREELLGPSTKAEFELRDKVEKGAQDGSPEDLYELGMFYLKGKVGEWMPYEHNSATALECFIKAAEAGHVAAAYASGNLYQYGREDIPVDMDSAVKWYRVAAENGHSDAMTNLAFCLQNMGKSESAVKWLEKACEAGDTMAMGMLSLHYMFAVGIEANPQKAFALAQQSADAGDAGGQKMLGLCYLQGIEVEQDLIVAAELFTSAANQGDSPSMLQLAGLLMGEYGYPYKDFDLAEELLERPASEDNARALFLLGWLHFWVHRNPRTALEYLIRAIQSGSEEAKDFIETYFKKKK